MPWTKPCTQPLGLPSNTGRARPGVEVWAALAPSVCAGLGVSLRLYVWGIYVRAPGNMCVSLALCSRGDLRCVGGCILHLPPGRHRTPGRAGVNEALSAPGCTQGLRGASLIRLLSPQALAAGSRSGRQSLRAGLHRRPWLRLPRQQDRGGRDPVPSGRLGSARPQDDPWETCPSPGPLSPSPPGAWPTTVLQGPERGQHPGAYYTGPLSSGLCPALAMVCQGLSLPIYEMGRGVDLKAQAWGFLAGPPPRSS